MVVTQGLNQITNNESSSSIWRIFLSGFYSGWMFFFFNLFWWSIYNIKFTILALFKYTVQWQKYIHIVGPPHHDASPEIFHHPNGRVASEYIQVWLFFQIDFLEMFFWRNFWIISQFLKRMCIWVHHTSSISSNACFALFVC